MDHMHGVSTIFLKHCDMVMSLLWGVGATRWAARLAAPISDGGPWDRFMGQKAWEGAAGGHVKPCMIILLI